MEIGINKYVISYFVTSVLRCEAGAGLLLQVRQGETLRSAVMTEA